MIGNENKIENIKCVLLGFAPKPSEWRSQQAIRHSQLSGWGSNSLVTLHPPVTPGKGPGFGDLIGSHVLC